MAACRANDAAATAKQKSGPPNYGNYHVALTYVVSAIGSKEFTYVFASLCHVLPSAETGPLSEAQKANSDQQVGFARLGFGEKSWACIYVPPMSLDLCVIYVCRSFLPVYSQT